MGSERKFFGGMGLVAVLAVAALFVGLVFVALQSDLAVKWREETVVRNGLSAKVSELAAMVVPQASWDEAVQNLDLKFDSTWASQNVGDFLGGVDHFDAAIVLDSNNLPQYGWLRGDEAPPSAYLDYVSAASTTVSKVRAAETARGPIRKTKIVDGLVTPPIQFSDIRMVGGTPFILTSTLVQPDFATVMPNKRSAVVLTARAADAAFLKNFGDRFMLKDLALATTPDPKSAHIPLRTSEGRDIGLMQWTPQRPGTSMLFRSLPLLLAVSLGLLATVLILWKKARRAIGNLVASEARAKHMAAHDALTGLPNRVLFHERLGLALENSRRTGTEVAVLCIDLDRFKIVNDTYGHNCGDELIREAARRLASTCRAGETLARLGGDEFAVVQPDATPTSALRLAERIQQVVSGPVDISAGRVFLACSAGITVLRAGDHQPAEVLRQADLALYQAKDAGRGGFRFFEPEMDAALRTRRELESELRDALAAGDLNMVYQPQVNGRGKIVGVEALVRWAHPERGQVSPAFFVPIAEECGLIDALGFYTLRAAFLDAHRWPTLKMAINLSASQLRTPDFLNRLQALVTETGIDPTRVELEITEGVLLGDDVETQAVLRALRDIGFALALDDFGTGYSSLSYLRRFPVNKIKIDRSFIATLGADKEAEEMVGAIVRLARALNLHVIAEGVETEEQRRRLAAAGCNDVQGFLFGKPSPPEAIDALLSKAAA